MSEAFPYGGFYLDSEIRFSVFGWRLQAQGYDLIDRMF
jgi:hypothetical protein